MHPTDPPFLIGTYRKGEGRKSSSDKSTRRTCRARHYGLAKTLAGLAKSLSKARGCQLLFGKINRKRNIKSSNVLLVHRLIHTFTFSGSSIALSILGYLLHFSAPFRIHTHGRMLIVKYGVTGHPLLI